MQVFDSVNGYVSSQTVASLTATFSGLPAGRSYVVSIYAHNAAGYSPNAASNVIAVPAKVTAPAAPTSVVAATTTKGSVKVTWTAPAGPVASYVILAYDTLTGLVMTKTVTRSDGHSHVQRPHRRSHLRLHGPGQEHRRHLADRHVEHRQGPEVTITRASRPPWRWP